ncbi:hypothetical protein RCL1_001357 [Eukaryota sp. TZLM3-RCL]
MFTTLVDKVYAGLQNDIMKATIKATNHEDHQVKDKHVRFLIINTHSNHVGEILSSLSTRLASSEALIVLKSLILLHRLIREGSHQFLSSAALSSTSLLFHNEFSDTSSQDTLLISNFIRKYSSFLDEILLVFRLSRSILSSSTPFAYAVIRDETDTTPNGEVFPSIELFRTKPVTESYKQADYLLQLLEQMLKIDFSEIQAIKPRVITSATTLILTDCFKLTGALIAYNRNVLDVYFTLTDAKEAEIVLKQYEKFTKLFEKLSVMNSLAQKYSVELPAGVPDSIVSDMKIYLENLTANGLESEMDTVRILDQNFEQDQKVDDLLEVLDDVSIFDDNFFQKKEDWFTDVPQASTSSSANDQSFLIDFEENGPEEEKAKSPSRTDIDDLLDLF